jgi:NodT family efflux transporter outer membrane factor (OMF) lipoprotein
MLAFRIGIANFSRCRAAPAFFRIDHAEMAAARPKRIGIAGMSRLSAQVLARPLFYSAIALALGACAVGPDFQRPVTPDKAGFAEQPLPQQIPAVNAEPGGQAQQLRAGNDLASQWWTLYHSEALNHFIEAALRDNASLASAAASLRQAQEVLAAGRGSLLPAVNAQAGATRERETGVQLGNPAIPGETFNLYNAQVGVSYTLDLFGGVRRQIEGLQAQVDVQQNELRAAQLALTANIVTAVVREAQLREQILALRDVEKSQRDGLAIVERRFNIGAVTRTDVLTQRSALATTLAAIPPLERQRAQLRHQLAVYAGRSPAEFELAPLDLASLELPADLPVSLPSELARQRPDILAAEALLHQASAQVGVATANLYPQLTLSGNYGTIGLKPGDLFKPASAAWGLTAGLTQPLFHGGALMAQRRAALDAFDAAAANYRQTVLLAFANVADALRALELDAQALAAVTDAYVQARDAAQLAQKQFDAGAVSYLTLLTAQQQFRQAAVNLVQARADRFADTAALFQALGGGWWNEGAARPVASN